MAIPNYFHCTARLFCFFFPRTVFDALRMNASTVSFALMRFSVKNNQRMPFSSWDDESKYAVKSVC